MSLAASNSIPVFHEPFTAECGISRLGQASPPPHLLQPHRHPFSELFWISAGTAVHRNDLRQFNVDAGSFVLVPAGQVHAWENSQRLSGYVITFTEALFARSEAADLVLSLLRETRSGATPPVIGVPPVARPEIDAGCEHFCVEYEQQQCFRLNALRARLELLLIACSRHAGRSTGTGEPASPTARITQAFFANVERDFRTLHHAHEYARLLKLSPQSLYNHVQRDAGKSPAQWIEERLVLEARRLLHYSSLSIGEIAYELGFRTPSNFGRFFKKHTGTSPGESRAVRRPN